MTSAIISHNPLANRVELALCSQSSHSFAVSECFLANDISFLVLSHHGLSHIHHDLFKLLSEVHYNGEDEKNEKGELPALLCHFSRKRYVIQANDGSCSHGSDESNHHSKVWPQARNKSR